jgi:hypothetical protein
MTKVQRFPHWIAQFFDETQVDRIRTALFYLESAAAMGYEEANFEMYKAHAFLARELKAMSKDTIEQTRKDTVEGIESL